MVFTLKKEKVGSLGNLWRSLFWKRIRKREWVSS